MRRRTDGQGEAGAPERRKVHRPVARGLRSHRATELDYVAVLDAAFKPGAWSSSMAHGRERQTDETCRSATQTARRAKRRNTRPQRQSTEEKKLALALCLFINPGARFQHNTPPKRPPLAAAACSTRAATVANLVMRCPGPMNNAYFGASVTPGDDRACCFESTLADRWGAIFEAVARTQCSTDKAGDTSFRFTNSLGPTNCDQWSSSTTTDRSGTQDLSYALFDTFHHPKSDRPIQRANHQLNPQG